ncbi:Vmh family MBL fold metallo-hydrolase [Shewanella sp. C32]|uniref:Vmh family MBL fold metallo-hydrolase n=1 Tax=Shewanella electrica TaxID=515560 RepID=A0ABT2FGX9_9GAMM|nr:Vmh family MBL fold metallo-hydrolase [Shewanella electrica]MCH1923486.1 Vmh family MBL fold metallo-hydrolase [Shewanella electrica]MCS4555583.1 Vmh family MBL fold metallo-hydrolase [Shewanella electrica]
MKNLLRTILAKVLVVSAALAFGGSAAATELQLQTYNPQQQGVFPISSTLITGPHQAMLVDAQFSIKDGAKLVALIKASGKQLTTILITCGDPDFYFGLQPIVAAFPDAKVLATQKVVDHINATKAAKIAYWGPILQDGAPSKIIVPQATAQRVFKIDGEVVELHKADDYGAFLWVPQQRTILGGVGVAAGQHIWTADTQTKAARQAWRDDIDAMLALQPAKVIPGHFIQTMPSGVAALQFTKDYLQSFEDVLQTANGSAAVIAAMRAKYPNLAGEQSLELSAKVNTGEMKW